MSFWMQLLTLVMVLGVCYWIYTIIRKNPGSFSRVNLSKSFFTMGVLALILIGFIWFLVILLR